MILIVDVQVAVESSLLPVEDWFVRWLEYCLPAADKPFEITVRLVDQEEMRQLNTQYRNRNYATNILSFVADYLQCVVSSMETRHLGDLVLCVPVLIEEAQAQHKSFEQHLAHLLVHGCLHLQGWEHEEDAQAQAMEAEECRILQLGGFDDPYKFQEDGVICHE